MSATTPAGFVLIPDEAASLDAPTFLAIYKLCRLAGPGLRPLDLTNEELGEALGCHPGTARNHLAALEAAGLIRRQQSARYGETRTIHFTRRPPERAPRAAERGAP